MNDIWPHRVKSQFAEGFEGFRFMWVHHIVSQMNDISPNEFQSPFWRGFKVYASPSLLFHKWMALMFHPMGFKIILYTGSRVLGLCKSIFCFMKVYPSQPCTSVHILEWGFCVYVIASLLSWNSNLQLNACVTQFGGGYLGFMPVQHLFHEKMAFHLMGVEGGFQV